MLKVWGAEQKGTRKASDSGVVGGLDVQGKHLQGF